MSLYEDDRDLAEFEPEPTHPDGSPLFCGCGEPAEPGAGACFEHWLDNIMLINKLIDKSTRPK